jgi:small-conductance mechanosensitive channel
LSEYIKAISEWITSNVLILITTAVTIIVIYGFYKVINRQIIRHKEQKKLDEHLAFTLNRVIKWVFFFTVLSVALSQFGVTLGAVSGLLTLLGGTIVGFAAINTIGNAIAGLIVMTSRPFRVGDRIQYNNQFMDVTAIELIYTKMKTLDNVLVSVPNQELLKTQIDNFGKNNTIRRQVAVTPGFEYDSQHVEKALLEAADKVPRILKEPKPYVRITKFQDYAVEYTLYVFINEIKQMREIDAELHKTVLENCKKHNIDISTPVLLKQIKE